MTLISRHPLISSRGWAWMQGEGRARWAKAVLQVLAAIASGLGIRFRVQGSGYWGFAKVAAEIIEPIMNCVQFMMGHNS